jgi:hypothetical protein
VLDQVRQRRSICLGERNARVHGAFSLEDRKVPAIQQKSDSDPHDGHVRFQLRPHAGENINNSCVAIRAGQAVPIEIDVRSDRNPGISGSH